MATYHQIIQLSCNRNSSKEQLTINNSLQSSGTPPNKTENNQLPRIMIKKTHLLSASLLALLLNSCGVVGPIKPNPDQLKPLKAVYINPHEPGTYAHFKAKKGYPRNYGVWKNSSLIDSISSSNSHIKIDLSDQRGYLYKGSELVMDYPISSGRSKYPTPTGTFYVKEKIRDKRSNLYGKIYNASGGLVKSDADTRKDTVPEGGKYVGASMPYWMRLTGDGIGMHQGKVPRHPASHGCIRTHSSAVSTVYSKVRVGTKVTVVQ